MKVVSLAPTPPANAFIKRSQLEIVQDCFPLDLFFCKNCFHVQLLDIVDPKELFENYVYVSGTSPSFVKHFENYAKTICNDYNLLPNSLIVEIGSNDGTLLSFFKDFGMRVLGIDPARSIAQKATKEGIETLPEFFTSRLADDIYYNYGPVRVVTANNVFAHADDLIDIVNGCKRLLEPDGLFIFEVQYLSDLYCNRFFDMIYHEHLSYHTIGPLKRFLEKLGMELLDVSRVPTHGGSIRCVVQIENGIRSVQPSVDKLINEEKSLGLYQIETFFGFQEKIQIVKKELHEVLSQIKAKKKSLAGFGAPAKTTTLMYHFDIDREMIDFIVDDSPLKQGLYTPGHHIPVLSTEVLHQKKPDYLLILAWNFATPIIENHQSFIDSGGHFIIPLPEVKII